MEFPVKQLNALYNARSCRQFKMNTSWLGFFPEISVSIYRYSFIKWMLSSRIASNSAALAMPFKGENKRCCHVKFSSCQGFNSYPTGILAS